ncbi:hypothetical protein AOZ06_10790 [Kibdelosporangium phytohabitans]|uniref:BON domain-containing protein n=1 Tax=Kibdelosporangium phytohabitans TaxID=860235 RepID=A0A0N9HYI1_9PSEU|nr:hypothetical protein AOZ06_10790 [Kibdelosporangium phytohabitans]
MPAAITVAGLAIQAGGIERAVAAAVRQSVPAGDITVDGRDVTIRGVPAEQVAAVKRDAEAAQGVRVVSVVDPRMPPMRITGTPAGVTVTGSTHQQAWRERFVRALSARTHGRKLVDQTTTVTGTDFPLTTSAAEVVVSLLSQLPDTVSVDVAANKVIVTGSIPDDNRRRSVVGLFKRLFGESVVTDKTTT